MVLEGTGMDLTDVVGTDQLDPSTVSKSLDSSGHHVRVEDGDDNFKGRIKEGDAVLTKVSKRFMCVANATPSSPMQCHLHIAIPMCYS
jgi:hypothetical protein